MYIVKRTEHRAQPIVKGFVIMKMLMKDLIAHVYTDCLLEIEQGGEEADGTYFVQKIWQGTAANLPKKYYDSEIAIITPPKYGAMKILLR